MGSDTLDGKVGRIYMPKQTLDTLGLSKMKGLKRERRAAAAASKAEKQGGEQPAEKRRKAAVPDGEADG